MTLPMSKAQILIVDDDVALARFLSAMLERTGLYQTRVETRPFAVLATAREFVPDLILMDVDMPGKDGGEVARALRKVPEFAETPILFLTALVSKNEASLRDVVGGKRILAKPVEPHTLLSCIEHIFSEASARA